MRHLLLKLCTALVGLLLPLSAAFAEEGAASYEPYQAGQGAQGVSAPLYVLIAYSVIWLAVLLFVVSVWRRQQELQEEMRRLEEQLGVESGGAPLQNP